MYSNQKSMRVYHPDAANPPEYHFVFFHWALLPPCIALQFPVVRNYIAITLLWLE